MWRLGRALERADMTTRVLGVRAAAVLSAPPGSDDELRYATTSCSGWACCARCRALQMYQRAVRGPIEGPAVVRFLLEHDRFPRAVRALLREIRRALAELPDPASIVDEVDAVDAMLRGSTPAASTAPRSTSDGRPAGRARPARPADHRALPAARPSTTPSACPRPSALLDHLLRDHAALIRRQAEADRVIAASGAGHLVHEMNVRPDEAGGRPWRIDPVPLVLDASTFDRSGRHGGGARAARWRRVLADLYGPRSLVARRHRAGRSAQLVAALPLGTGRHATAAALADHVRRRRRRSSADGSWRVVQDLTDAPTGLGYALLDRSAMLRVADELLGAEAARRRRLAGRVPGRAAPRPDRQHARAEPAHRAVHRRRRPPRLRGALVARPAARLHARRATRPRRAPGPAVAAHARRARPDRRRVPPGRGRRHRPASRSARPAASGVPGLLLAVADGGVVLANAHGIGRARGSRPGAVRGPRRAALARHTARSGAPRRGRATHRPGRGAGVPARRADRRRRRGPPARRRRPRRRDGDARRQRAGAGTGRRPALADGAPRQGRVGGRHRPRRCR